MMPYGNTVIDGRYEVIKEIGSGGTGVVYLAYHIALQKKVVLKKIKKGVYDPSVVRREADLLKDLHHTYLPAVYDFLVYNGDVYTVIDFIEGYSLDQYIDSGTYIDPENLKRWFIQLCEVLDYLHSHDPKIIHSDIKPANIIITPDNNVCLIDFNISLDGVTDAMGYSKFYASPEQISSAYAAMEGRAYAVDERTDIFSLGATFYHLFSWHLPAEDAVSNPPLTSIMPTEDYFYEIIDKCMRPDPNDRYSSSAQLLKAVRDIRKHTREYKAFSIERFISVVTGTFLIAGGVWLCVHGGAVKKSENFKSEYSQVLSLYNEESFEKCSESGLDLINKAEYKEYFDGNPEYLSEIMYVVSESYAGLEDYDNAAYYSKQALDKTDYSENNAAEYYLAYVSALINSGNMKSAEKAFEKADKYDLDKVQLDLLHMELYIGYEKYSDAVQLADSRLKDSTYAKNEDFLTAAAKAYEQGGKIKKQISCLEKLCSISKNTLYMRRLGAAYASAASAYKSQYKAYSQKACACFESLVSDNSGKSIDYINLLKCYEALEDNKKAQSLIEKMLSKFTDDYRIYAEAANYYYSHGMSGSIKQYAKKADKLFPKSGLSESDAEYRQMIDRLLMS